MSGVTIVRTIVGSDGDIQLCVCSLH